jgi:hypothetical protein
MTMDRKHRGEERRMHRTWWDTSNRPNTPVIGILERGKEKMQK